jgi:hypothetical protein
VHGSVPAAKGNSGKKSPVEKLKESGKQSPVVDSPNSSSMKIQLKLVEDSAVLRSSLETANHRNTHLVESLRVLQKDVDSNRKCLPASLQNQLSQPPLQ